MNKVDFSSHPLIRDVAGLLFKYNDTGYFGPPEERFWDQIEDRDKKPYTQLAVNIVRHLLDSNYAEVSALAEDMRNGGRATTLSDVVLKYKE